VKSRKRLANTGKIGKQRTGQSEEDQKQEKEKGQRRDRHHGPATAKSRLFEAHSTTTGEEKRGGETNAALEVWGRGGSAGGDGTRRRW